MYFCPTQVTKYPSTWEVTNLDPVDSCVDLVSTALHEVSVSTMGGGHPKLLKVPHQHPPLLRGEHYGPCNIRNDISTYHPLYKESLAVCEQYDVSLIALLTSSGFMLFGRL